MPAISSKISPFEMGQSEGPCVDSKKDPISELFHNALRVERTLREIDQQYARFGKSSFFQDRVINLSKALEELEENAIITKEFADYFLGGEVVGGLLGVAVEITLLLALTNPAGGLVLGATFGTWGAIWLIAAIAGAHIGEKAQKQRKQNIEDTKQELMAILHNMMKHKEEVLAALKPGGHNYHLIRWLESLKEENHE
jgi:hypothetical protein